MRLRQEELLILRLRGRLPRNPSLDWLRKKSEAQCLKELRKITGVDFETDLAAWERWVMTRKARRDNRDPALLIARLRGETPPEPTFDWLRAMTPEECLRDLRVLSGQDLGNDPSAWVAWAREEQFRQGLDGTLIDHLLFPEELLLRRLDGTLEDPEFGWLNAMTPEECYRELSGRAGVDLGTDLAAWQQWWRVERPKRYLDNLHLVPPYNWTPEEALLRRLRNQCPPGADLDWLREISEEDCFAELRGRTGMDLGRDVTAWEAWERGRHQAQHRR